MRDPQIPLTPLMLAAALLAAACASVAPERAEPAPAAQTQQRDVPDNAATRDSDEPR